MDPHHVDADPDPALHFDADRIRILLFTLMRIRILISTLMHILMQLPSEFGTLIKNFLLRIRYPLHL